MRAGDELELRGPIGGYFTWTVDDGGPLLLVAGGSGLVPLMAMLRHRAARASAVPTRGCCSPSAALADVLYRAELDALAPRDGLDVRSPTRAAPRRLGRLDAARRRRDARRRSGRAAGRAPHMFVCGPTAFVEPAATLLVEPATTRAPIHAERFGPTGG